MRKLILLVFLLAALAVIVWVNMSRDEQRRTERFKEGFRQGLESSEQARAADSLSDLMAARGAAFEDSIASARAEAGQAIDSLQSEVAARDDQIAELSTRTDSLSTLAAEGRQQSIASPNLASRHAGILSYYRRRHAELPGDLSDYERRAALKEIRKETASKFAISAEELDKILSDAK